MPAARDRVPARPWPALLLAALLLASLPLVAAQTEPVLVDRVEDDERPVAGAGDAAVVRFELLNLNPRDDFYVRLSLDKPVGWTGELQVSNDADPGGFFLGPRNRTIVTVLTQPEVATTTGEFVLTLQFVNGDTGEVTTVLQEFLVGSSVPPRVLGILDNPLPPPLDTAVGTFALEMLFWIGVALFAILVGDNIVRVVTTRASNAVTREILQKLRKPIFLFVLFLGLARSFAILPPSPVTGLVARTLVAVGVGVFGLYVLFRIIDSALLYYATVVAPRTSSTFDDMIVSVTRKFGIAILWVVGVIFVLRTLGWDPTVIFAGAGIAGLVIAFAAQDTISNVFSGIFLLVDRPFTEGDDIKLDTGEIVRVLHIGLRTTRLYHGRFHESIVVPNNQLAQARVVNLAGPDSRYWVMLEVGVAYESDPRQVERILMDIAMAHPKIIRDEQDWTPIVIFSAFADSSLNFVLRCALRDFRERFLVASELRYQVFEAFEKADITIPFPQRTVWLHHADKDTDAAAGAIAGAASD